MTYGLTNCQQTVKFSMDFTFVNFRRNLFLNRAMWFPIVFISTPGEMGVKNQAVCF